jgi:hypothetical protein
VVRKNTTASAISIRRAGALGGCFGDEALDAVVGLPNGITPGATEFTVTLGEGFGERARQHDQPAFDAQ